MQKNETCGATEKRFQGRRLWDPTNNALLCNFKTCFSGYWTVARKITLFCFPENTFML